ncbi:MAG: PAS domain-containing protein [Desulfobulbaceae bacterium]|nr:PAS domain-containing protein [Desulfobulbaceae bacterium]
MSPSKGPKRIFYASPLLFASACVLLTVIIGVFAVNNVRREKQLMTAALSQEGQAILNLVAASTRASLRRSLMRGELDEQVWQQTIRQAIENGSDHSGIDALYLVTMAGDIVVHSDQTRDGTIVADEMIAFLRQHDARQEPFRIVSGGDGREVFQVALPFAVATNNQMMPHPMGRGRQGRPLERLSAPDFQRFLDRIGHREYFWVVELGLETFHQAVRQQFIQVGVLSLVLLLVGIGGILSLMTLQGLRGSQIRLTKIREFTDLLVSSLPVGLIATGPDGRVRTCNASACSMLRLEEKQVLGKPSVSVLPERFRDLLSPGQIMTEKTRWEVTLPERAGGATSLHIVRLPLEDPDREQAGMLLLIQDLSQIRALESELARVERDAAIGKMAAGVAHEIRNPLSSIKGLAILLQGRLHQDALGRETVGLLVTEVERLNRSIGELLDYARPTQLQIAPVEIDAVVAKAVALLRSDALAAGIEVKEHYRCGGRQLAVDQDRLIQVVLNLGLNAIQAMDRGGVLTVATDREGDRLKISIIDDGPGIAPELLETVFDPYVTTKPEGTGLGLALSRKIIDDHHGRLTLDSTVGQGTSAVIDLPC